MQKNNWEKVKPIPLTKIADVCWQDPHCYFEKYSEDELEMPGAKFHPHWIYGRAPFRTERRKVPCWFCAREKCFKAAKVRSIRHYHRRHCQKPIRYKI